MSTATKTKRIPFSNSYGFGEVTQHALNQVDGICTCSICASIEYLAGAEFKDPKASSVGATYKQLAYIAHQVGMTTDERIRWYEVAQTLNLSQAHAASIIVRLRERDQLFTELDEFLTSRQT